jgi:protein TIF31
LLTIICCRYASAGQLLQESGDLKAALEYLRQALHMQEHLMGPEHVTTASTCHSVAMCLSMLDDSKEAIAYEKRNYAILKRLYGEADTRTIESNTWLKQITMQAVRVSMEAKKMQQAVSVPQCRC